MAVRLWRKQWAERTFADDGSAIEFVRTTRWPNGVSCPKCASARVRIHPDSEVMRCQICTTRFSVRAGTVFGGSKLSLRQWLIGLRLITSHPSNISSVRLAADLGITQLSAWRMKARLAQFIGKHDNRFSEAEKVMLVERLIQQGFMVIPPDRSTRASSKART